MQEESTEGILLQSRESGESDLILTFWTAHHGRLTLKAPKARKSQKRFGGDLRGFARLQLFFRREREEGRFWQLLRIEALGSTVDLSADLLAFAAASFAGEIMLSLNEEGDANPSLYELLTRFLDYIAEHPLTPKALLRFELRLLDAMGFLPSMMRCLECGEALGEDEDARFDLIQGGLLCLSCRPASAREAPPLKAPLRLALLHAQRRQDAPHTEDIWCHLLDLLDRRLCHLLGKESRSRAFLREIAGF
jgi:DNA repair protein RecO (recombination protein O)